MNKALHEQYPRLYKRLKEIGHSPGKAVEILLDAKRGVRHALHWCRIVGYAANKKGAQ